MKRIKHKAIKNRKIKLEDVLNKELEFEPEDAEDYTSGTSGRSLYLTEQVDKESIQPLIEAIHEYNEIDDYNHKYYTYLLEQEYKEMPINLYINSPGGDIDACLALLNVMENSKTPIYTHCIGSAASAALIIFSVGSKRIAYKHSSFMYHQLSSYSGGTFKDIEEQYEQVKIIQSNLEKIFLRYTKFTEKELEVIKNTKKDYYFDYKVALQKGVADLTNIPSIYKEDLENFKQTLEMDNDYVDVTSEHNIKSI